MKFDGYKVVITGATSGIGLATAKRFLKEGATVIGIGRNFKNTADLGDKFIPCKCDITDLEQINQAVAFITETFGGELDTFVSNAGLGNTISVLEINAENFEKTMNLLLRPAILFGNALYPLLQKAPKKNASIVNVSSVASRSFQNGAALYGLCKQALVHFTKFQADAFEGVRCNSVCPGFVDTAIFEREGTMMTPEVKAGTFQMMEAILPVHHVAQPEELANVIAFVASENAKYITGADFLADGGFSLRTV